MSFLGCRVCVQCALTKQARSSLRPNNTYSANSGLYPEFKSLGVKIRCVDLHYNVAFTFKCHKRGIPETKLFIPKGFELGTTLSQIGLLRL